MNMKPFLLLLPIIFFLIWLGSQGVSQGPFTNL